MSCAARMHTFLGIPFISLVGTQIKLEYIHAHSRAGREAQQHHRVLAQSGDELEVAMLDTDDLAAIDFIKKKTHLKVLAAAHRRSVDKIRPQAIPARSQRQSRRRHQAAKRNARSKNLRRGSERRGSETIGARRAGAAYRRHAASSRKRAERVRHPHRAARRLVPHPVSHRRHLARCDGIAEARAAAITARIKVLRQHAPRRTPLAARRPFRHGRAGEKVSFRVSVLPTYYGEKIVMRILRDTISGFTLESIGFHGVGFERMHEAMRRTTGMVLTTGPTGAGKSTTLYTLLDIVNTPDVNISTIEDPIEYQMKRVNQTQVRPEIGFTFANGLRSLVRQDPDIIMVGEIRDKETASLAVNAALTGHLVLSTLHTNSAAGAVARLHRHGHRAVPARLDAARHHRPASCAQVAAEKEKHEFTHDEQTQLEKIVDVGTVLRALKEEKAVPKDATWKKVPFYHTPKKAPTHPRGFLCCVIENGPPFFQVASFATIFSSFSAVRIPRPRSCRAETVHHARTHMFFVAVNLVQRCPMMTRKVDTGRNAQRPYR